MARRINLIPPSERTRTTTNFGMLGFVATAIIVIFGLGLGYYLLNNSLDDRKDQLAIAKQQTQALQSQVVGLKSYAELDTQRKQVEKLVQGAYASRTLVAQIMDTLSLVLPENVWFNSLDLTVTDPGAVSVAGPGQAAVVSTLTIAGDTYSFPDVAQILVRLQLVPSLDNITLGSAGEPLGPVDTTKQVKGFSISATVNNTQPADVPLPISQVEVVNP